MVEGRNFNDPRQEKEPTLDLNIMSFGYCNTIDELVEKINAANEKKKVDLVLLQEFNFTLEEVLNELGKIKEAARQSKATVILAPDNNRYSNSTGREWGALKERLQTQGVTTEAAAPNDYKPESIGIYVDKMGFVYAFPKTFYQEQVHNPVHKIPNTRIGVAICGEIGLIKSADLEGINVLYNPSREGDDPALKYRMLGLTGHNTRDEIIEALKQDGSYDYLLETDEEYRKTKEKNEQKTIEQLKGQGWSDVKISDFLQEFNENEKKYEHEETEPARRKRFEDIVDSHLQTSSIPKDSHYIKHIVEELRQKNIPVVRSDVLVNTGVLNQLPNMEIKDLAYESDSARYRLILK